MQGQTTIHVVSAADLKPGDTIPVVFAIYGEIMCPVSAVSVRPCRWGGVGDIPLVDVSVRIGSDGPGYGTVVRSDEHFTVIR